MIDGRKFNKKKEADKKNHRIELLLNAEEKQIIIIEAKTQGLPISTYIRWKLLKKSV